MLRRRGINKQIPYDLSESTGALHKKSNKHSCEGILSGAFINYVEINMTYRYSRW